MASTFQEDKNKITQGYQILNQLQLKLTGYLNEAELLSQASNRQRYFPLLLAASFLF